MTSREKLIELLERSYDYLIENCRATPELWDLIGEIEEVIHEGQEGF
jgi:hypothetical protein